MEAGAPGWELAVNGLAHHVLSGQQKVCRRHVSVLVQLPDSLAKGVELVCSFEWKLSVLLDTLLPDSFPYCWLGLLTGCCTAPLYHLYYPFTTELTQTVHTDQPCVGVSSHAS